MAERPPINVGFNFGLVSVEVEDIFYYFGKRQQYAGPFLIVERYSGLALETDHRAVRGWQPFLGGLHGGMGQRWVMERLTEHKGEVSIRSELNGLALDSTWDYNNGAPLLLWDSHGQDDQRWRLRPTPDKTGWYIESAKDERIIDVGENPEKGGHPWMYDDHGLAWQQFLILPVGKIRT